MALTLSRSVSTTATSRAARSSRARAAVSVKPMAFHYDTRRYRACRPSMTPYRSPLIAGLGFIGPMLASEWLAKSVQQQSPSMDISTREEEYTLSADCPGMGEEDINIEISPENVLTISGSRKATSAARKSPSPFAAPFTPPAATTTSSWPQPAADAESPEDGRQRIEDDDQQSTTTSSTSTSAGSSSSTRVAYSFRRSFVLPEDVDVDGVKAQLDKGVLTLTLPRRVVPKPPTKRVTISSSKPDGDSGAGSGSSSGSDTKDELWA